MEQASQRCRRVVIKVGSSSITDADGQLSVTKTQRLVRQFAILQQSGGWQIVMVSSGALAAGLSHLGWSRSTLTQAEKQAASAVGQTLLMHTYEQLFQQERIMIGQLLLTRSDMVHSSGRVTLQSALETLLQNRILPILNENDPVASATARFGDNDTLAGVVSVVSRANRLILLTDVNGLYAGDPKVDPAAAQITDVMEISDEIERIAGDSGGDLGTGGMRTKVAAARIAMSSGADVIVASSEEPDVLMRIANNELIGTMFHACSTSAPPFDSNWFDRDGFATYDLAAMEAFDMPSKGGAKHVGRR